MTATVAARIAAPIGLALALGAAGLALAQGDSEATRARLQRLYMAETVLTAEQGRNLNQLARLLTLLLQFRRDPPPALLVSPTDAKAAVRGAILVKAMTPVLQERAHAFAAQGREIARQRRLAAVASEALFTAESDRAELRPLDDGLLDPEGLGLRGLAEPKEIPRGTPPSRLIAPASGEFAYEFGDTITGGGKSNGLAIATGSGAAVQAPGEGTVEYVGPVKGWGVILILRLTGGYHLVLAGLDRANVGVGQSVAAGSPVGAMPDGRQSPSELYLEVRERGVPVDPGRWLKEPLSG
ncbi:murein hydrolase activator EnvC family protein [Phenylobacterium sp.]|jgi:septal ring factor EnvC (AmiA/AmiB activator)|uniref:murein hydrolase activator EnvC family protein n=1 Tax=Phenylobacterium sp. TaxID=1871053 RepID=UPI002E30D77D|nr:peptidoglycan DD-metalloendopeptidase family protein [Phenylobacterium sp.]HEX2558492.1 peptidoglycan DD-metalloendopeptidase family protein [Phenylobacterium sp.]